MRIRHYFASLAPPADQLPNDEEDAPRKKEVANYDCIQSCDLVSQHCPQNLLATFFWEILHSFARLFVTMEHKR